MGRQGRRERTRLSLLLRCTKETCTDDALPSFQTGYTTLTMAKVTSLPLLFFHRRSLGTWVFRSGTGCPCYTRMPCFSVNVHRCERGCGGGAYGAAIRSLV